MGKDKRKQKKRSPFEGRRLEQPPPTKEIPPKKGRGAYKRKKLCPEDYESEDEHLKGD